MYIHMNVCMYVVYMYKCMCSMASICNCVHIFRQLGSLSGLSGQVCLPLILPLGSSHSVALQLLSQKCIQRFSQCLI